MTNIQSDTIREVISRLENRKLEVWKKPNPMYRKGEKPEHIELNEKIEELKGKLKIKS